MNNNAMMDTFTKQGTEDFLKLLHFRRFIQSYFEADPSGEKWEDFLEGGFYIGFKDAKGNERRLDFPVLAEYYEIFENALDNYIDVSEDTLCVCGSALKHKDSIKAM